MVTVSIIIPNWNGMQFLKKCLDSVFKQEYHDFEVILVDNASTDDSVAFVKKKYPKVKIIRNSENYMFAKGCNIGVQAAKGDFYVLLNNDTIVHKKWLSEMLKAIKTSPAIKGVGSLAFNRYGAKEYVFPGHGTSTFFFQNTLNDRIPKDIKSLVDYSGPGGGSCMFRNDGALPFDGDYFMYGEDTYHAMKLRLQGFTHKMVPTSVFHHEGEGSSKRVWSTKIFFQERNRWLNVLIIWGPWTLVRLAPLAFINIMCTLLYDPGNALTRLKSYGWFLAHPKSVLQKRKEMQSNRKVKDDQLLKFLSCKFYEEYLVSNKMLKGAVVFLNKLQYFYCRLVCLKTMEMYRIENGKVMD